MLHCEEKMDKNMAMNYVMITRYVIKTNLKHLLILNIQGRQV